MVQPSTQASKPQPTEMTLGRPYRPASATKHKLPPKAVPVASNDTPAAASSPDAAQPSGSGAEDAVDAIATAVELPKATLQKLMAPPRRGSSDAVEKDDSLAPAAAAVAKSQQSEVREARWD